MQPETIKKEQTFNTNEVNKFIDNYKAITASNLNTPAPVIPTNTKVDPFVGLNAGAKAITSGLTAPTYTPPAPTDPLQQYLKTNEGIEAPNQSNIQAELEKQAGIEQKTQTANALKAQIDALNAEEQVALRTLESQSGGKDVTSAFLGRQQQEISRQSAIRSLPLTAQYQAALGDLQGAQNTVTKLFTAKLADAQNQYENKKEIAKVAYQYATDKEKAEIRKQELLDDREYEKTKTELAFEKEKELLKYKQQLEGTGGGGLSSIAQAVIENPNLFSSLTPSDKASVISQLQSNDYDTSNLGTKPLSDAAKKEVNQTNTALSSLDELKTVINNNLQYIGPIKGLAALNPWSKARQAQADIDRVRQVVGKALEGGVLRKEDEEKYKKILATLTDTPETALYKIEELINNITNTKEDYLNLQTSSGKSLDIKSSIKKKGSVTQGQTTTGNSFTITNK